jgi:phosphoribosylformylglycinamidine cyclo-ligase
MIYALAMTTYKDSGVDTQAGGEASKKAYEHACATFASRKGKMGTPVEDTGGFAGLIDMGGFYLVQNDDGTGSKMEIAHAMKKYDTLGYDLLAMVVDDAICTGAEVISVSNTLDVPSVDTAMVDALMGGLSKACQEQNILIPGGEIAEVPGAVHSPVWNATSVGIIEKGNELQPATIAEGDTILALQSGVARSNGFSLIRKILSDAHGEHWYDTEWKDGISWGEIMLKPSVIYHGALLSLLGRFGEERTVAIKSLTHITGGGIAENLERTLRKSGLGAELTELFEPHDAMKDLIALGNIDTKESYRTWNMGNGMLVIVDSALAEIASKSLVSQNIQVTQAGVVTKQAGIDISAYDGTKLSF